MDLLLRRHVVVCMLNYAGISIALRTQSPVTPDRLLPGRRCVRVREEKKERDGEKAAGHHLVLGSNGG